jgi:TRAP-type C4-dicarboxylate transport system permease small subunit
MKALFKGLDYVIVGMTWVALAVGVIMMFHVSADVAGRFFGKPFPGTNEIVAGYYMILLIFLPWAHVTREGNHICAEMFVRLIPPAVMAWVEVGIKILTLVYICVFTWQTWFRALQQMDRGEALQVVTSYLPVWPSRFALPFAGGLMALYLVLRIISDIRDLLSKDHEPPMSQEHEAALKGEGL